MQRRTKIVASLGPATDDPERLRRLIKAGTNVVRLNFSHGEAEEHIQRAKMVREIADELNLTIGVLGDLQGPKIRIRRFANKAITLNRGDIFCLDASLGADAGNQHEVGITYTALAKDVNRGDRLMLDDGTIELAVHAVTGTRIETEVKVGGELSNNKGINLKGGGLSAGALTEKDRADIQLAAEIDVDFLAVSFVRHAADVEEARNLLEAEGGQASLVAKVERKEALDNIGEIITASDAIMIARGDLGVEIGDENLPAVQKRLIRMAREHNRAAITATQMMQSMIESPTPTRAEVSDVANAVLDGTDAVMLSAETAVGKRPHKVVKTMSRICLSSETDIEEQDRYTMAMEFGNEEECIAMSAMFAANHFPVAAILALTESGRTAQLMSRQNASIPIYAMTRNAKSARRICLVRGVAPINFDITELQTSGINRGAVESLKAHGLVEDGELIIITRGDGSEVGGTNTMKIVRVGQVALQ